MTKFQIILSEFIEIACGLVTVISLGNYNPKWEIEFMSRCVKNKMRKKISKQRSDEEKFDLLFMTISTTLYITLKEVFYEEICSFYYGPGIGNCWV